MTEKLESEAIKHWDSYYENFEFWDVDKEKFYPEDYYFFNEMGDLKGKKVLDLGCGNGEFSMYYARRGAIVTSIDTSEISIINTLKNAEYHGVKVNAIKIDAFNIRELNNKFDIIAGKMILHHLEPFNEFIDILKDILEDGGKCFFFENNARNKILMFFRFTIAGRFGIPKLGDYFEHPFEYNEYKMLKRKFKNVSIKFPYFKFFVLLAQYLFKNNITAIKIFEKIDAFVFKYLPFLKKYSYWHLLIFSK
jgi:SAM-dependent methyltransferase